MHGIQSVGIGGHGGAFGQDVESGKKPQTHIKAIVAHVSIAFGANEFKGQK